ncbi:MAG TPA: class I SAM-dependent methyltransferase [Candidatus Binataceae bacterium]|jgi:SAM-dependent methyltransferase|nr:class I SAM-dependent methyltransferase [Candidatus Binataceae bacterium]
MEPSIYAYPAIFRRVHMERPGEIAAEVGFLKAVWRRHLRRPVRRVLDVACGDSPHGLILAREGVAVAGIDRSPTMVAAGRRAAAREGVALRFYRRSIERFTLPERPFDAAFFMSETFPIMTDNRALLSHLASVGRLLRRGALYCVDIDRHDGVDVIARRRLWRRRRVRVDSTRVDVREYHRPIAWYSGMHSIYELECTIRFPRRGAVVTRDVVPVRYTLPCLLELAALASGYFEMVAAYADLSFTRPMERCYGRWLGVLRRK